MELSKGLQLKKQKSVEIQEPWAPTTPAKITTASFQKSESPCELTCQYGSSGLTSLPGHLASSGQATSGSIVMLHTPATSSNNCSSMGPLLPQVLGNKNAAYSVSGLNKVLMRIGNGLEMPANSNILVLNANSFLNASPSNCSYSSNQPDRLPVTSLPNLNSVPSCPVGVSMAVITPALPTPATIEKCSINMKDKQIPLEITNFAEVGEGEENLTCNGLMSSQLPMLAKNVMVLDSKLVEFEKSSTKRENDGIDWNIFPTKKPRRKKHRPRVIIDGKPSRIFRQATLPETPEQGKQEDRRSYKRTYVRRKKDTPAFSDLNALEKNDTEINRASARRCLKFDSTAQHALDEYSTEVTIFEAGALAGELCHDSTGASSCMKETVHSFELYEKVIENSLVPIVTDLSTVFQSENEYHKILSAPIQSAEVNKIFGTSEKQMTTLKFSRKKLKELARKKACADSGGFNAVSFSEAVQNSLNSCSISNLKHKGTMRDQHVADKDQNSAEISFNHSYNLQGCLQKIHNATNQDSSLPVKRKRTKVAKMRHNEATSDFSPKYGCVPKGWKLLRLSDTVLRFTFTDPQSFITQDTMLASEKMLSFKCKQELHGNPALGSSSLAYSTKPSMQNNMNFLQPSTPEKLSNFSDHLKNRDVNQAHLMVSNISYGQEKAKKRGRKKQDKVQSFKFTSSRVKHERMQILEDSCYVAGTPVQSIAEEGALASKNLCLKNSICEPSSVGYQSKRCFKVITHSSFLSGALNTSMDCVDEVIQKLKSLSISRCSEFAHSDIQNILVPYVGHGGMIVPYEGNFDMIRKRHPRAKVDLDPESNRVWKLLMGKDDAVRDEQADMDKESWWSEERRVFKGRVDSFIARMHLVQGDRRFSQWKGSVVDSVVGVFLTQNVSDHLSSSAFMALIANFPLQQRGKFSELNGEKVVFVENADKKGTSNCTAALLTCSGSRLVDYSQENANLDEKVVISDHESCTNAYGTIVSPTENTSLGDMKNVRDLKDVPTQNSVVSSQNFMECKIQSNDHISANSDGLLGGNLTNAFSSSSFIELLQMAECSSFQELFIHGSGTKSQEAYLPTENCLTALNKFGNSDGTCPSVKANSNLHLGLFCSSTISPSKSCQSDDIGNSKFMDNNTNPSTDKTICHSPSTRCEINFCNACKNCSESEGSLTELSSLHKMASSIIDLPLAKSKQHAQPITLLDMEASADLQSRKATKDKTDAISTNKIPYTCSSLQAEDMTTFQNNDESSALSVDQNHVIVPPDELDSGRNQQTSDSCYVTEHKLDMNKKTGRKLNEVNNFQKIFPETPNSEAKNRKKVPKVEKSAYDWEDLRKKVCSNKSAKGRSDATMDSLDWEAVRCAEVSKIADTIRERGMNNVLAERIQEFLNRLVREHGCIDLEWLRDLPPDTAKDYLLSIRGLGLKSVECVRLLALQQLAFPVDTNVGRICVRLGWVPLQPLPESLQLHLLELYPVLESIQKYLWPRLCKLDQRTLYELHYQMITFGKVFCTKSKPNCNACPLRSECKHFASAFASARLALPAPKDKSLVSFTAPIAFEKANNLYMNPSPVPCLEVSSQSQECSNQNDCIPIVEEPTSPEPECCETIENAIEDAFYEDPDEIPLIKLNLEEFSQNLLDYMQENMEIQDGSLSKALVALTPEAASIPMPKLKNVSRLRTEHQVYELPDSHPVLNGVDPREPDDPSPYLLAIWTPGETAQSTEPPNACCESQNMGQLCDKTTCFACSSVREAESHKVRGTLLIPCRTAMRGSFPLNGTYFQVNEVFADHHSSCNPIDVPRDWIWNLPRRTVFFGTSIPTIFRGLTTEGIQHCFWRGFVCVRGFDRVTGAPKPLYARLHFPASKASNIRKAESVVREAMLAEDVENSATVQL